MNVELDGQAPTPEAQLQAWMARLDAKTQKLALAVRASLRKRLPTANELAYDYTDSVVISYSPTDKGIAGVLALKAGVAGVALYFNQGPELPDPKGLLQGKAKQTRFIAVEAAAQLDDPDVQALIGAAVGQAKIPLPAEGQGRLINMSGAAAAKKKPRRP